MPDRNLYLEIARNAKAEKLATVAESILRDRAAELAPRLNQEVWNAFADKIRVPHPSPDCIQIVLEKLDERAAIRKRVPAIDMSVLFLGCAR
jgi:hypothetical protein